MSQSFFESATNPTQYDLGEVDWKTEGSKQHFTRRMILEAIYPHIGNLEGKMALDIGSGQGWLCRELSELGAHTVGIDPSAQNTGAAHEQFPDLDFRHASFNSFQSDERLDLITATMVFEHLGDLKSAFDKARTLLTATGRLLIVDGDFERFTMPRFGYTVELEPIREGEIATRTDYGERAGVLYDIFRTPERFIADAALCGLENVVHEPYSIPDWVLREQPRYELFEGKPVFQVLRFEAK